MDNEIIAWAPAPGEKAVLKGTGSRSDFSSVQTILYATKDTAFLTGGWLFEWRNGDWRTPSSSAILLHPAPHLNLEAALG